MKIPVTVGILTFNSEKTLRRTLESVKDFGEIIVCDGGSHDKTLDIAKVYGATIISQNQKYKNPNGSIANFSGVRNQMLNYAKHDWFLFIDSDEYLSEESVREIESIAINETIEKPLAYWMPRKRVYNGKIVECTTTYPNYQMRFFHKKGVERFIKEVHERIEVKKETRTGFLKNPQYVPFEYTRDQWRKKLEYYINIEVQRYKDQPFPIWIKMSINSIKVSLLFALRHVRIILFCRGHTMPLWYELMQHWYHWQLIVKTGKKYLKSIMPERGAE